MASSVVLGDERARFVLARECYHLNAYVGPSPYSGLVVATT
jgi:hypothetical protein